MQRRFERLQDKRLCLLRREELREEMVICYEEAIASPAAHKSLQTDLKMFAAVEHVGV